MAGKLYAPDVKRAGSNQVWFRYWQQVDGAPEIRIYNLAGALQQTINGLGSRPTGTYASRSRAIFWDKEDSGGMPVAGGVYTAKLNIGAWYDIIKFTLP